MFCTNCGNNIPDDMKFCSKCGTPANGQNSKKEWITGQPPSKKTPQPPKSTPKEFWQGQPPKNLDVQRSNVTVGTQNRFVNNNSVTQAGIPGSFQNGNVSFDPKTTYVLPDNSVPDATQFVHNYDPVYPDDDSLTYLQVPDMSSGNPPKPPKNKKKIAVIAVVIALVILILASVTTVGIVSAINKSELDAEGVTYVSVDEFPVLKKETELVVYNAKYFPAKKYGIKVERFLIGGFLRNLNIKEEILVDESSASSYYLTLDDGEYRITLVDLTAGNNTDVIIIDAKVDDDNLMAAYRVNIGSNDTLLQPNTPPEESGEPEVEHVPITPSEEPTESESPTQGGKPDIEATESDFEELADLLLAINFTEYDSGSATTAYAVDYMLTGEVASWGYDYFYKDILRNPTTEDPAGRFGKDYRVMNASSVEWICLNILNINFDPDYSSSKSYLQNGKIYRKSLPVSENVNYFATLSSYKVVGKKYEVTGEYYSAPVGTTSIDERATLIGKYIITAELKNINGREQWTIYSIEQV